MNEKTLHRQRPWVLLLLLGFALAGPIGCADSDSQDSGSIQVNVSELQQQVGYSQDSSTNAVSAPTSDANNPATSVAKSVVVGAIVVRSRTLTEGPYGDRTPLTPAVQDLLEEDIRNSASFINLVNLPTTDDTDTIDVLLPPATTVKWQILGAALSSQPANKEALGDQANKDATIYIGWDDRFLATQSDGTVVEVDSAGARGSEVLTDLTLNLKRACLVSSSAPPKGCAQFDGDGQPVVSSAVEIIGVEVNGVSDTSLSYPMYVRTDSQAATAVSSLFGLFNPATDASVEVFTTHQLGPDQSAACQNAVSAADLETECGVESYFTPGENAGG